jgi:hypothetical protein
MLAEMRLNKFIGVQNGVQKEIRPVRGTTLPILITFLAAHDRARIVF